MHLKALKSLNLNIVTLLPVHISHFQKVLLKQYIERFLENQNALFCKLPPPGTFIFITEAQCLCASVFVDLCQDK